MIKRKPPDVPRRFPKAEPRLYLAEYLELRGMKAKDLAGLLDVAEATVSRYLSGKREFNQLRQAEIEAALRLRPGGLFVPPTHAPGDSVLSGLTEAQRIAAISYISYLKNNKQ